MQAGTRLGEYWRSLPSRVTNLHEVSQPNFLEGFFRGCPQFNLESSPLMQRIVELKENGYADKDSFEYVLDVLEVAGDITANTIFPNSEDVDAEGPHCEDGRVRYASKTYEPLAATRKAGLNGVTMPRRFGGLNFP